MQKHRNIPTRKTLAGQLAHNRQPQAKDVVLGGRSPVPFGSVVLGGIAGVKQRLASTAIAAKISALTEALNYGKSGIDLIIHCLEDESLLVQRTALLLLWRRSETYVQQSLTKYSQYYLFDIIDTIQGAQQAIASLALSPNGKILYSAGSDFKIRVWDLSKESKGKYILTVR